MIRSEILKEIAPILRDQLVVCNIGIPSQELHAIDDQPTNFYMLGTMGLASSIGLGLALAEMHMVIIRGDRHPHVFRQFRVDDQVVMPRMHRVRAGRDHAHALDPELDFDRVGHRIPVGWRYEKHPGALGGRGARQRGGRGRKLGHHLVGIKPAEITTDRFARADGAFRCECREFGATVQIGDAVAPRTVHEAVLEARRAAHAI